jgi:hypothetical protein
VRIAAVNVEAGAALRWTVTPTGVVTVSSIRGLTALITGTHVGTATVVATRATDATRYGTATVTVTP